MSETWVVGRGEIYLGEGVKYVRTLSDARRFHSKEAAVEFVYDGRPQRGCTFIQKIEETTFGVKSVPQMSEYMMYHLGLKPTSVMDNTSLLKLSVKKFG